MFAATRPRELRQANGSARRPRVKQTRSRAGGALRRKQRNVELILPDVRVWY